MGAAPTVAVAVAEVGTGDDVHQAAGGTGVGIVIDGENVAEGIAGAGVRIPITGGPVFEVRAVEIRAEEISSFSAADVNGLIVGSEKFVGLPFVFAAAEVESIEGIEGETAESIVGILRFRFEEEEALFEIGLVIAIGIPHEEDLLASGDIYVAVRPDGNAHGGEEFVGEEGLFVGAAVVVFVGEDPDAVGGMALVSRGGEVGVAFDGPDSAAGVDANARGGNDLRVFGEEFELEAGVEESRGVGCQRGGEEDQQEESCAHGRGPIEVESSRDGVEVQQK